VDALRRDWRVIAPDWRGFGFERMGERATATGSRTISPIWTGCSALPAGFSGHARRPQHGRQRRRDVPPASARARGRSSSTWKVLGSPARARKRRPSATRAGWPSSPKSPRFATTRTSKRSPSAARNNSRLSGEKAAFLARQLGEVEADGRVEARRADPEHKLVNPVLYRSRRPKPAGARSQRTCSGWSAPNRRRWSF